MVALHFVRPGGAGRTVLNFSRGIYWACDDLLSPFQDDWGHIVHTVLLPGLFSRCTFLVRSLPLGTFLFWLFPGGGLSLAVSASFHHFTLALEKYHGFCSCLVHLEPILSTQPPVRHVQIERAMSLPAQNPSGFPQPTAGAQGHHLCRGWGWERTGGVTRVHDPQPLPALWWPALRHGFLPARQSYPPSVSGNKVENNGPVEQVQAPEESTGDPPGMVPWCPPHPDTPSCLEPGALFYPCLLSHMARSSQDLVFSMAKFWRQA